RGGGLEAAAGFPPVANRSRHSVRAQQPIRGLCQEALAGAAERGKGVGELIAVPAVEFLKLGCLQAEPGDRRLLLFVGLFLRRLAGGGGKGEHEDGCGTGASTAPPGGLMRSPARRHRRSPQLGLLVATSAQL